MSWLKIVWDGLRSSLWFIPALMVLGSVVLAGCLIEVEWVSRSELVERWPRLFGAGAEGTRGLLSAIASSMITVAGVTFSMTVVALALASNQYTSRVLRTFMRDVANQAVLGVFAGVFVYCLVVLRTVRDGEGGTFVPSLAVFVALVLALVAIGFLIFFVHHVAISIQATSIIAATTAETLDAVDRLFPSQFGEAAEEVPRASERLDSAAWCVLPARKTGYIQSVQGDALVELARKRGLVLRMERGVGDFVIQGTPLLSATGAAADAEVVREANDAFLTGRERTVHQDVGYGIRQLVDVALKALSPGINDTTTAINCVDGLGAILVRLSGRSIETRFGSNRDPVRVISRGPTFTTLLAEALDEIRRNARSNIGVLVRILELLCVLRKRTQDAERQRALAQQVGLIRETAATTVTSAYDRALLELAASGCERGSAGLDAGAGGLRG